MAVKKFLDASGVTYLASLLDNYPDNEILGTVITAIQEALDEKVDAGHTHTAADVGALPDTTKYVSSVSIANHGEDLRVNYSDSTHEDVLNLYSDIPHTVLQTTAGSNNVEYNLIGTAPTNTNTSAVTVYNPAFLSFANTNDYSRLTVGATNKQGRIKLYSNLGGLTDIITGAAANSERTITLPDASGTLALTSQIPNVPSWALTANKPTYTASEVGAITSSEAQTMIGNAVSGITSFSTEIVSSLPSTGMAGRFYFLANGNSGNNNIYDEYIYVNNAWEKLGTLNTGSVDLSGYLRTSDIAAWAKAANKPTYTANEVGALASNTTYVSTFNGQSGAVTYIPPVTSVNNQTGAVTIPTYDDTALAARVTALENIPWVTYYTGTTAPDNAQGQNGDLYFEMAEEE